MLAVATAVCGALALAEGPARQGGDTCATATVIAALPYHATGTTVGYTDDYDEACPYAGAGAPDVVYSYDAPVDTTIDVSLCYDLTDYDTKLYVYEDACPGTLVACNEDACSTASNPYPVVSELLNVPVQAAHTYYIIIDGFGDDAGNYELYVEGPPAEPVCPPDSTLVGHPAHAEYDDWAVYASGSMFPDSQPPGVKCLEHFCGAGGPIDDVHWWGISATTDGSTYLTECPLEPGEFLIEFYDADPVTGWPDYDLGALVTYTANDSTGLTKTDSGHVYAGGTDDFALWYWEFELPQSWTNFEGWIAIQNTDSCVFWWATSPDGDGIHLRWDEQTDCKTDEYADLSYCLTALDTGPFTGACCDRSNGVCRDTDATDCCGPYDEWHPGIPCIDLSPPCEAMLGACCINTLCMTMDLWSCESSGGSFWPGRVCDPEDPAYIDCESPLECPETSFYSQPGHAPHDAWVLGYSDIDANVQRFESFSASYPIHRVTWWGAHARPTVPPVNCYEDPLRFDILFYSDDGATPGTLAHSYAVSAQRSYTPVSYYGSLSGWQYEVVLTPACPMESGWISIVGSDVSASCQFRWLSGSGGDGQSYSATLGGPPVAESYDLSLCLGDVLPGACCYATGECQNTLEDDCVGEGTAWFEGESCEDLEFQCPKFGACCLGAVCEIRTEAQCAEAGGVYVGDDTDCSPLPCRGACCRECEDGFCDDLVLAGDCAQPGSYWVSLTLCADLDPPCGERRGDANCDGAINTFDIDAFVLCLTDQNGWEAQYGELCDYYWRCDCNCDGEVNTFDIDPFVELLTGR